MSQNIHLTSGEIASLWTGYMNDSMSKQILGFMLKGIQDTEIKPIVQYSYDLTCNHLDKLAEIFKKEDYAEPNGFSDKEVNMDAPWLFTDTFCLSYVNQMARIGGVSYGGLLSMCTKQDVREYFTNAIHDTSVLYNRSTEIGLKKGVGARQPYIEVPKDTDFIDSKEYLSGINPFNEKRALNAIEISYLYMNVVTNSIGLKLCLAFAQTSPRKEVQEFMIRCKEVSKKHIKIFVDTLLKEDVITPEVPDYAISNSTTWTFSDKIMMFHMSLLMQAGIGNYATAAAASQRSDLMINYERLSLEVAKLAKSGADIMIQNSWLEQPPGIKNRDKLARNKEKS